MVHRELEDMSAAVLCDSMCPHPFMLTQSETEDLLTACAIEGSMCELGDAYGHNIRWGCFLVTDSGSAL